jgi:hypothetical protein
MTEIDPGPNFPLTEVTCDDQNSTTDLASATATVRLDPGETVRCVFTNADQRGEIIVEAQVAPGTSLGLTNFSFETDFCGPVPLSVPPGVQPPLNCFREPGTYTMTEIDPGPNFPLTEVTCDDQNSTTDLASATATVRLDPGETVRCVFTHTPT